MADTIANYTGNGTQTDFVVPFEYLKKIFIHVYVNKVPLVGGDQGDEAAEYFFVDNTTIRIKVAPAEGTEVTLRRITPADARIVSFEDGSILKANDLDTSQLQTFHIAEEARDQSAILVEEKLDTFNDLAEDAAESAQKAQESAGTCAGIRQEIERYSWDLPHLVDTLKDVEDYGFDGLFVVGGFEGAGEKFEDISHKYVKANDSTKLRTLGERFADVVNVCDYGAKGDGKTDDTSAFLAAAASNKRVFVPQGKYLITKNVSGDFYSDGDVAVDCSKITIGNKTAIGGTREIFVDSEKGSDFNTGRSVDQSVKSLQRAINIVNTCSEPQSTIRLVGDSTYEIPSSASVFSGMALQVVAYNGSPTLKFTYTGGAGPRFYAARVSLQGTKKGKLNIASDYDSLYFEGCSCSFTNVNFLATVGIYGGSITSDTCSYKRVEGSATDLGGVGKNPSLYLFTTNARLYNTTIASTDGDSTGVAASHGSNVAVYGYLDSVEQTKAGTKPLLLSYNSFLALNYTSNVDTLTNTYLQSVMLNGSTCKLTEKCFTVINKLKPSYSSSDVLVGSNIVSGIGVLPGATVAITRMILGGHITGGGTQVEVSIPMPKSFTPNVTSVVVAFTKVTIRGIDGSIAENVSQSNIGGVKTTYFNSSQINLLITLKASYQKPSINNTPVSVELNGLKINPS